MSEPEALAGASMIGARQGTVRPRRAGNGALRIGLVAVLMSIGLAALVVASSTSSFGTWRLTAAQSFRTSR